MNIQTLVVGSMATNCYIAGDMIIDPGDDAEYIMEHLAMKPKMIVATHGHFDHLMAARAIQLAYNIPFYIHEADMFLLSRMQESAQHFLGLRHVDPPPEATPLVGVPFIHTPGHTPGSITLVFDGILLVGDTLFAEGAVGRTDFAYSSARDLSASVEKIMSYPKGTRVLPGHGEEFTI